MKKSVAFLFALMLVLAACAPSTQDSGMAGEVRTESQDDSMAMTDDMAGDMTGGMSGGAMDMQDDMNMDDMGTGGMEDMSDMDGMMTGGSDGLSVEMEDMTGGSDMGTDMAADTEAPQGTLEVAASPAGPFYNDRPGGISKASDERVVSVAAGDSFYLRLNYSDPSGITGLNISLRNSDSSGTLPAGPFTVDEADATSTCDDQLAADPTELNCTIKVDVAADAQNISESGEFAYVFRAQVSDAAGNNDTDNDRGYVAIR